MSDQWAETCLVCCEKTKNRCSKCAEAGIDLFFCSSDHQKLVWKTHRQVCGPGKANPFVWPLLSVDEAREAIEHMHESTGLLPSYPPKRNTVAKALQDDTGIPIDDVHLAIEGATMGGPPIHAANFMRQQLVVATVRSLEYARVVDPVTSVVELDAFRQGKLPSAWGLASDWDIGDGFDRSTFWAAHGTEPWRPQARHYVLMGRLVLLMCANRRHGTELASSLPAHRARLADYVRTAVAASNPRLAAELLVRMDQRERVLHGLEENLSS